MTDLLKNPIFLDETKARDWLEARVWANGRVCPHCGNADQEKLTKLDGKAHRPGVYQCNEPACREQFTVTVGTVFESSKIPLSKWLAALFLMTASKKGISAHQVHRMLGISYKSTWFLMHRLREAMRTGGLEPLGGEGKVVEADETYFGKADTQRVSAQRKGRPFTKNRKIKNDCPIISLIERGGNVRSFHVAVADSSTVASIVNANVKKESRLHTDESKLYKRVGTDFAAHETVTTPRKSMRAAMSRPTRSKATSQCSSAVCAAPISIAPRSICTAISRSLISATTTASLWALTIATAPTNWPRVSLASA
jgi:transposase-like protein